VATTRQRLIVRVCAAVQKPLINLALFQMGWLVCVLGGSFYAVAFTLLTLLLHRWLVLDNPREWKLIAVIALGGCLWDAAMTHSGVIRYADGFIFGIPLWLVCLWLLFATTFMHSLLWLRRYLWLAALLAAVLGPVSYWLGSNLTEAELRAPLPASLAIMAVGWALLFPAGIYYAGKVNSTPTEIR
jgi:hypothetical protein